MKNDFLMAITQLCAEKNLSKEVVIGALEDAMVSAYKKNFGSNHDVVVRMDPTTGQATVYTRRTVVAEVTDPATQISVEDARRLLGRQPVLGEVIEENRTPREFGRIAAQTAKQVITQRLREAEQKVVYDEYTDREGEIVTGTVQRIEPNRIIIALPRAEAILPSTEQVPGEQYRVGQRIKVYLVEVNRTPRGPQLIASRTHRNLLRRLFELEVPEINHGIVEIKAIAREPGSRSKVAVAARQPGVDPVGACVGLRGIRIQNIVNELNGEKIDVIEWHPDPAMFVAKALSPAQVLRVLPNEEEKTATCIVPDRQLSLAIGKEGQNARLAAKLTGWRIDIKSASAFHEEEAERLAREEEERAAAAAAAPPAAPPPAEAPAIAVAPPPEAPIEMPAFEEPAAAAPVAAVEPAVETPPAEEFEEPLTMEDLFPTKPGERGKIRFAEEILGVELGRKKGRDRGRDEEEPVRPAKKGPRRQRVYFEEDDEEAEYEDILRRIR
ncbi:MAG: transcription termination factor NusA [Chloroflexota bacterium]|nr:transcription termination factor NusA [Dehalococcoidia bacterium]MDW8252435.1 transcription termination factor NusA [Chloroflexota bacterium]